MRKKTSTFMGATMLALEAQQVIALRMMRMALGGPKAASEAHLMIAEKVAAANRAATLSAAAALTGQTDGADRVVRMLRQRVRANRRRLLKG